MHIRIHHRPLPHNQQRHQPTQAIQKLQQLRVRRGEMLNIRRAQAVHLIKAKQRRRPAQPRQVLPRQPQRQIRIHPRAPIRRQHLPQAVRPLLVQEKAQAVKQAAQMIIQRRTHRKPENGAMRPGRGDDGRERGLANAAGTAKGHALPGHQCFQTTAQRLFPPNESISAGRLLQAKGRSQLGKQRLAQMADGGIHVAVKFSARLA